MKNDTSTHAGEGPRSFRVVPVLDIRHGQAVHARGGVRRDYLAVRSTLTPSVDPVAVARAFRERLGLEDLYLADLDAIEGRGANAGLLQALVTEGFRGLVDLGIRSMRDLDSCFIGPGWEVIVGSESVSGAGELARIVARAGPGSTVFSLDLRAGEALLPDSADWPSSRPEAILDAARAAGVARFLLLDLARVGSGRGCGTETLLDRLTRLEPRVEVLVGGGIGTLEDARRLRDRGASGVLIASALHDGRIGRTELVELTSDVQSGS